MSYTCPFCGWPSLRVTSKPAEDDLGNKYHHAICKGCDAEATFIQKPKQEVKFNG
jgi:transcription elongation factor Elf1